MSEISTTHVGKVDDVLSPGDSVLVMVKEIDDMGRINLSRRRALERRNEPELAEKFADALVLEDAREERIKALPPSSDRDRGPRGGTPRPGGRPGGDRPSGDRRPHGGPRRKDFGDRGRER